LAQAKLNERLKAILLNYLNKTPNTSFTHLKEKFAKEDPLAIIDIISHLEVIGDVIVNNDKGTINFVQNLKTPNYDNLLSEFGLNEQTNLPLNPKIKNTTTRSRNAVPMQNSPNTNSTPYSQDQKFKELLTVCQTMHAQGMKSFTKLALFKRLKWGKSTEVGDEINRYLKILLEKDVLLDVGKYARFETFYFNVNPESNLELLTELKIAESKKIHELKKIDGSKTQQKSPINNVVTDVLVLCTKCGFEQIYHPRTNKRQHKYCDSCKKHFDIKLEDSKQVAESQENMDEYVKLELQEIDKQIIGCFFDKEKASLVEKTQKDLVILLNKNKSTISRHLDQLIKLNLIEKIKCDLLPNAKQYYRLVSKIPYVEAATTNSNNEKDPKKKTTDEILRAVTCHKAHVTMPIIKGEFPDSLFTEISKMTHWTPRYFERRNVKFTVTTQSLTFTLSGIGKDRIACNENVYNKSIAIQRIFEDEFKIKLGTPIIKKNTVHYVPIHCELGLFDELTSVWTDKSHKGKLETDDEDFLDKIVQFIPTVEVLQDTVKNELEKRQADNQALSAKIDEIKTAINNLKNPQPDTPQIIIANQNEVLKSVNLRMELLENRFELKNEEDKQFQKKFIPLFQMMEQFNNQKQNSNENNQKSKSGSNSDIDMFL
jgi:predicted transcriptional regulator